MRVLLPGFEDRTLDVEGVSLLVGGRGPALLLLHGSRTRTPTERSRR